MHIPPELFPGGAGSALCWFIPVIIDLTGCTFSHFHIIAGEKHLGPGPYRLVHKHVFD